MIPAVAHTAELQRILSLPRRTWSDVDLSELAAKLTAILRTPTGTMSLRPVQALALHDAGVFGGLFGPIGVGEGKTLITLLLPLVFEAKRPLLLLPAGLIEKTQRERRELSKHWRIPNTLRVFSYDMLGRVQAADELHTYQPDAIICDEVHRLRNRRAAVTRRVARYMYDRPYTKFAGLSGTIMSRSIKDLAHILRWSLKLSAPIPVSNEETEEWAQALDEGVDPLSRRKPGALLVFCADADRLEPEHIAARRGFCRRLVDTPGVVATVGEGEHIGASIYVKGIQHSVAAVTEQHFKMLRTEWRTPDGWELSQATDIWRHSNELALGFHYVRVDKEKYASWRLALKRSNLNTRTGTGQSILLKFNNETEKLNARNANRIQNGITNISASIGPRTQISSGNIAVGAEQKNLSNNTQSENSSGDTVFQKLNSTSSPPSIKDDARSVKSIWQQEPEISILTTTTLPAEFEVFSAETATRESDASVTMSASYREQFPIFLETARPPKEWLEARSAWAKFVRETLSRSRTLDSELQVANACDDGRLPADALKAWRAIKDTFSSVTVPVWHDDSALKICIDWMHKPGIVWVEHRFFGACLSAVSGVTYYAEGGYSSDGGYIEDAAPGTSVIASLCNREGKNLQHRWHRNLLVYPPASAAHWEQIIARTHRPGQTADEVTIDVLLGCRENFDACMKALEGAKAIRDMTGKQQKLLLADVTLPSESEINALHTPRWRR